MCYAIPAKIVSINKRNNIAVVDYFGEQRKILLDAEDTEIGDYIYAQGGIAVRKISAVEAQAILATWREMFFSLQKTDALLSKLDQKKISQNALAILQKVNLKKILTKDELRILLTLNNTNELKVIYELANHIRQREHGNSSCVHGILEFSNYCNNECFYCGIREPRNIKRYRMQPEEVITVAEEVIKRYGFKALVLQSGEDNWYDIKKLSKIIRAIKQMGVLVFLSIGMRDRETYQKLFAAGARAALLRFETSNETIFHKLRPKTDLTQRIQLIKDLKNIGYIIATGFIIGLPDETHNDIIDNILLTKSLKPDMYSFGPLIPTRETPLANQLPVDKEQVLKTIAITRFADSTANILVTSALETLAPNARKEALLAGANSLMLNVTPVQYRNLYSIYDNRERNLHDVETSIKNTVKLLYDLGRAPTDLGINYL
jgi:biotin synthase